MKQRVLLILSVMAIAAVSCNKKGGKSGLLVPKDAGFVIHINSSSLASKLSWSEIQASSWFQEMSKGNSDSLAQKLMQDPSSSGVDTKKDFVGYSKKQGKGNYFVFMGSLTSQATYAQMISDMSKKHGESSDIKTSGEYSYMESKGKSIVVWNKTMFAMVSNSNFSVASLMMKRRGMSENEGSSFDSDSLRIFGEQALSLEGGNNLDADSRFADLVKDGSDIHMWLDAGKMTGIGNNPMTQMMNVKAVIENNITAVSMNFDNGKISVKSKHYVSDQMAKIASNNRPSNVSADLINRIPSSDVAAVVAFNYSPEALKETLKVTGLNSLLDGFLSKADFSIDDFVKANKGEVLIAVSDLGAPSTTPGSMIAMGKPKVNYLIATGVKDKATFEKMVTLGWDLSKQMGKHRMDTASTDADNKAGVSYRVQNDWFALSNSSDYIDKFLSGNSNNKFAFTDKITGHPLGMYIDLQRLIHFGGSMMHSSDSTANQAINIASNTWQDVVATGGDFKDGSSTMTLEINMVDKSTNSLKQLNQFADKLFVLNKGRHHWAENMEEMKEIPAPPPPVK